MQLKRVEVIGDDEAEIGEATRRMSENYDFVVTRQAITTFKPLLPLQCSESTSAQLSFEGLIKKSPR